MQTRSKIWNSRGYDTDNNNNNNNSYLFTLIVLFASLFLDPWLVFWLIMYTTTAQFVDNLLQFDNDDKSATVIAITRIVLIETD